MYIIFVLGSCKCIIVHEHDICDLANNLKRSNMVTYQVQITTFVKTHANYDKRVV
jgi:hypothetical protein